MIVLASAVAGQVVGKLVTAGLKLAVADLSVAARDGQARRYRVGGMLGRALEEMSSR